jgi:hypothetical protein
MTIREAYARATVAKRLEIDVDNRTAADYLIASGWTRSRMAYLLRRLQSEWDGAAKKLHMEDADYILLVGSLATLKPAIETAMGWCERKGIPHGERVVRAALSWWLDNTCHRCYGRGYKLIEGTPSLGMACDVCHGSGKRREPEAAYRVLDMFATCTGNDYSLMHVYLRRDA